MTKQTETIVSVCFFAYPKEKTLVCNVLINQRIRTIMKYPIGIQDFESIISGGYTYVDKLLTSFLADIPYTMRRKETERERERYFHYTFYLLMRMVSCYTVYTEKQQSEGRVDCIVETPDYIYIFEFKLDGTADEALLQIEDKGYARPYEADTRKLFKVGTVFSSETGTISDFKTKE